MCLLCVVNVLLRQKRVLSVFIFKWSSPLAIRSLIVLYKVRKIGEKIPRLFFFKCSKWPLSLYRRGESSFENLPELSLHFLFFLLRNELNVCDPFLVRKGCICNISPFWDPRFIPGDCQLLIENREALFSTLCTKHNIVVDNLQESQ